MGWNLFWWNVERLYTLAAAMDFLGEFRLTLHTTLANAWLRKTADATAVILERSKKGSRGEKDLAGYAFERIRQGALAKPPDWSAFSADVAQADRHAKLRRESMHEPAPPVKTRDVPGPELRRLLRQGMSTADAEALLGQSTSRFGGSDVLGQFGSVSGSAGRISNLSARQYRVWQRPDGEWKLVFVDDALVNIYETPYD